MDLKKVTGKVFLYQDLPYVPKTTKGKVLPKIHSPIEPRIIRRPPKPKNAPVFLGQIRSISDPRIKEKR